MKNQQREPGRAGRKRQWQAHVKALAQSGLSRAEYCRRHGLSYNAMTYWIRRLAKTRINPSPILVPVSVQTQQPGRQYGSVPNQSGLRLILPGKVSIAVGDNFSADTLQRLLAVLECR